MTYYNNVPRFLYSYGSKITPTWGGSQPGHTQKMSVLTHSQLNEGRMSRRPSYIFQVGELIIAIQPDIPKSNAEANRWIIGFSEVSKCPIFEETNHHLWMGIAVNFGPPKSQWV